MRRDEIIAAVENLSQVLSASGLFDLAHQGRADNREKAPRLEAFRQFSLLSARIGLTERELIDIFGLRELDQIEFWDSFIEHGWDHPDTHTVRVGLSHFERYVPRIIKLLQNDALRAKAGDGVAASAREQILTAILVEKREEASRPARIVDAIRSIAGLYEVCAYLTNTDPESLAIIGCDSGSDKSFDFFGAASAIAALKEVILGIWDRIVFYRQMQNDANINQALKSLAAVEQVTRLQTDGAIDPERAERLRHQLISNATAFVNCGIIIPELAAHTTHNPRVLMAPQPKLLTSGINAAETKNGTSSQDIKAESADTASPAGTLSEDERRLLQRLLDRERGGSAPSG